MSTQANKRLITRFYEDLQNTQNLDLASELMAPDVRFRGSLGRTMTGVGGWIDYQRSVYLAIPDFHNRIDELVAEGDAVVARLTYSGTHEGELLGHPGTGRKISYAGVAIFHVRDGRIADGWVLGDLTGLLRQLEAAT